MIQPKRVWDVDREQFTGYSRGYYQLGDERVTFVTLFGALEHDQGCRRRIWATDEDAAWVLFDMGLKRWLMHRPGYVLWRMEPEMQVDEEFVLDTGFDCKAPQLMPRKRYAIMARVAVTKNPNFCDDLDVVPI